MDHLFDTLSNLWFGRTYSECKKEWICVSCGKQIEGFRDSLSAKEYQISGFCQSCQDRTFNEDYPTDGTLSDVNQLCYACHQGEMENGECNHCGSREVKNG
jgi:hypothetical protein